MFPEKGTGDEVLWMRQIEPTFGKTIDTEPMATLLSLNKDDIEAGWPIEEVSTGLPFVIVPVKSLNALKKVSVKKELYDEFIKNSWAKIVLVFSPEGYTSQQNIGVRVFPICYGITEDPATGSGNGCLAAYLVKNRYFSSSEIDIKTGQGYEIGRPSQIYLQAVDNEGKISINVGGKVVPIAEGYW
jgi:trans-2,3-dihydro-3-hydroxyanthranilate isomerase